LPRTDREGERTRQDLKTGISHIGGVGKRNFMHPFRLSEGKCSMARQARKTVESASRGVKLVVKNLRTWDVAVKQGLSHSKSQKKNWGGTYARRSAKGKIVIMKAPLRGGGNTRNSTAEKSGKDGGARTGESETGGGGWQPNSRGSTCALPLFQRKERE